MEYLYHGSSVQGLKKLIPFKKHTPQGEVEFAAIYATPLPGFAAAHSFRWSSDEGVYLEVTKDLRVIFKVPKQIIERLEIPISIYQVDPHNFTLCKEELTGQTYISKQEVDVIDEVRFKSVIDALEFFSVDFEIL